MDNDKPEKEEIATQIALAEYEFARDNRNQADATFWEMTAIVWGGSDPSSRVWVGSNILQVCTAASRARWRSGNLDVPLQCRRHANANGGLQRDDSGLH
jgi:hypothetical protein